MVEPEAYTYVDEVLKKAEASGKPGLVEIQTKEDGFICTVESTGATRASQLVLNAVVRLSAQFYFSSCSRKPDHLDRQCNHTIGVWGG